MIISALQKQKGSLARVNGARLFRSRGFTAYTVDLSTFYSDAVRVCSCVELDGARWVLFSIEEKRKNRRGQLHRLIYKRL